MSQDEKHISRDSFEPRDSPGNRRTINIDHTSERYRAALLNVDFLRANYLRSGGCSSDDTEWEERQNEGN